MFLYHIKYNTHQYGLGVAAVIANNPNLAQLILKTTGSLNATPNEYNIAQIKEVGKGYDSNVPDLLSEVFLDPNVIKGPKGDKGDVLLIDIKDYLNEGAILPIGATYIYNGLPIAYHTTCVYREDDFFPELLVGATNLVVFCHHNAYSSVNATTFYVFKTDGTYVKTVNVPNPSALSKEKNYLQELFGHYKEATTTQHGLLSSSDKVKLNNLDAKADKSYVDTELAKKADKETTYTKSEVITELSTKEDKAYIVNINGTAKSSDKTYAQMKAAYDEGKTVKFHIDKYTWDEGGSSGIDVISFKVDAIYVEYYTSGTGRFNAHTYVSYYKDGTLNYGHVFVEINNDGRIDIIARLDD